MGTCTYSALGDPRVILEDLMTRYDQPYTDGKGDTVKTMDRKLEPTGAHQNHV